MGSIWSVRNKDWAYLPICGALGEVLIIWDSRKFSSEEVVIGSFSVTINFLRDGVRFCWLTFCLWSKQHHS